MGGKSRRFGCNESQASRAQLLFVLVQRGQIVNCSHSRFFFLEEGQPTRNHVMEECYPASDTRVAAMGRTLARGSPSSTTRASAFPGWVGLVRALARPISWRRTGSRWTAAATSMSARCRGPTGRKPSEISRDRIICDRCTNSGRWDRSARSGCAKLMGLAVRGLQPISRSIGDSRNDRCRFSDAGPFDRVKFRHPCRSRK